MNNSMLIATKSEDSAKGVIARLKAAFRQENDDFITREDKDELIMLKMDFEKLQLGKKSFSLVDKDNLKENLIEAIKEIVASYDDVEEVFFIGLFCDDAGLKEWIVKASLTAKYSFLGAECPTIKLENIGKLDVLLAKNINGRYFIITQDEIEKDSAEESTGQKKIVINFKPIDSGKVIGIPVFIDKVLDSKKQEISDILLGPRYINLYSFRARTKGWDEKSIEKAIKEKLRERGYEFISFGEELKDEKN
jgi:hypothetical protein